MTRISRLQEITSQRICRAGVFNRVSPFVILMPLLVASASAQLINGRLTTSMYSWEKFDSVGVSTTFTRGFQVVQLDISQGNFSLFSHLQGAATFIDASTTADFRTQYLYGRLTNIGELLDFSIGRMPYFHGVGNGTLDGVKTAFRFGEDRASFVAYGGVPPPGDYTLKGWGSLSSNYVFGGQFLVTPMEHLSTGISYVNKARERTPYWTIRADSLFNPAPIYIDPELRREQYVGIDARYLVSSLQLYGRYDFDLLGEQSQRADLRALYGFSDDLMVNATYQFRSPRIPWNSFFSRFNLSNTHEVEAGVDFVALQKVRTFVRGAFVQYDGDQSFRYTVGGYWTYASISYRGSTGQAGELNSISLAFAYPLLERALIPNANVVWNSYALNASAPREETFSGALGVTVRPVKQLAVDVQGQWLTNSIYKNDLRIFAKINFWFSEMLNLL